MAKEKTSGEEHRKGQHLTSEERHEIEVRCNKDKWSIYKIAKSLHRPYNTIKNEIKCGTVLLYNGTVKRYRDSRTAQSNAASGYSQGEKHK